MQPERIFLSPPHMCGEEIVYVQQAFDSNYIAPLGEHVDELERAICAATGTNHAVALSSGTAAIHLALILLGVKAGDLVVCQSFTFAGTINPVAYLGAVPVLVDSEPNTWNMDPELLRQAIVACRARGANPKAIIPVDLYGMPAKMSEIMSIAREFEIPVIEDAAEALGARLEGRPCASLGDFGILSFNGNKILTTSGGGALVSQDQGLIDKARFLATQARDPEPHYEHTHIGYNYRMSNVLAAIGRGQFTVLDQRVHAKRTIHDAYQRLLGHLPGIRFLTEPCGFFSNRWLTTILVDPASTGGVTREDIRMALEQNYVESRPLWKPMHLQPIYRDVPFHGNNTSERLFAQGLCLPSGTAMKDDDLERVAGIVCEVVGG